MMNDAMQQMADELAIRRVLDEYCLRLEVNAFDEWLDLFTDDAVYVVHRRTLNGRAEISAMLSQAPHGVHLPGATRITIEGDSAEVIQSYLFVANSNDSWNSGWYDRTLVRTEGGWKISRTVVKMARFGDLSPNEKANGLAFPVSFE
jgi:ketosteroid isomerase-like protein